MKRVIYGWLVFSLLLGASLNAKEAVDLAIEDFGINMDQKSDPEIVKKILTNTLHLGDVPEIQALLKKKLSKPQPMKEMLATIRQGIIDKHPAMSEFLKQAHDEGLLPQFDSTWFLNYLSVFEDINRAMIDNPKLMATVQAKFLEKRREHEIREDMLGSMIDIYKAGGGLFGSLKAGTMDSVMKMYLAIRERGAITQEEIDARIAGLKLNITEAWGTDKLHKKKANAYAAAALFTIPPETIRVVGNNFRIQYVYPLDWTRLYQTWNLAFILFNLEYPELTFHKLLIPSVLCADSNDYLFNRATALWTTINVYLFAKLEGRESVEIPNRSRLADIWGAINFRYAQAYMESMSMSGHPLADALLLKMKIKSFLGL